MTVELWGVLITALLGSAFLPKLVEAFTNRGKTDAESMKIQADANGVIISGRKDIAGMSLEFVDKTMDKAHGYLERIEAQATDLAEMRGRIAVIEAENQKLSSYKEENKLLREDLNALREEVAGLRLSDVAKDSEIKILKTELNRANRRIIQLEKDTGELRTPPPHDIPKSQWQDPPAIDEPPNE